MGSIKVRLAALTILGLLLVGVANANADLPIKQFQTTYAAYDPYTAGINVIPQPDCSQSQVVYGAEPAASGKYPVLIYMHGTLADLSGNTEGQTIVQLAAAQGFVALAPTYESALTLDQTGVNGHAYCIFSSDNPDNVVSYACSLPEANCSQGVLAAGFSQGGLIAVRAKNYASEVDAVWTMGVNGPDIPELVAAPGGTRALPSDELDSDVGQLDVTDIGAGPFDPSALEAVSGDDCGASYDCLQPNGSGYYVVSNGEAGGKSNSANHCYWQGTVAPGAKNSCEADVTIAGLNPGFAPPSTTPWSLLSNLNWLRTQWAQSPLQAAPAGPVLPGTGSDAAGSGGAGSGSAGSSADQSGTPPSKPPVEHNRKVKKTKKRKKKTSK